MLAEIGSPCAMNGDLDLARIAAPMIGQSDLPFRQLVFSHGATTVFTQMLNSNELLENPDYLQTWLRDLSLADDRLRGSTVVQLCGNDPDTLVKAARCVSSYCSGIGMRRHSLFLSLIPCRALIRLKRT
jgi:tRNA-dihydrouridine synthase 1